MDVNSAVVFMISLAVGNIIYSNGQGNHEYWILRSSWLTMGDCQQVRSVISDEMLRVLASVEHRYI